MDLLTLLIVILVIAWATGTYFAVGSLVHLLLVLAIVVFIVRLLRGERL